MIGRHGGTVETDISSDQLRKMKFSDLNILSQKEIKPLFKNILSGEQDHLIFKQKLSGGVVRDVKACFDPIQINGRSFLFSIFEDITDLRHADEVKKELKFWSKEACQSSGTGTFTLDFTNDS